MTALMTSAHRFQQPPLARGLDTVGLLRATVDLYAGRSSDLDRVSDELDRLVTAINAPTDCVDEAITSARAAIERVAAEPHRRVLKGTLVSEAAALHDLFDLHTKELVPC